MPAAAMDPGLPSAAVHRPGRPHGSAKALAQLLVEGRRFGEPLRLVLQGIGIARPGAAEPLGQNLVGQAGVLGGGGQRLMADGKGICSHAKSLCMHCR